MSSAAGFGLVVALIGLVISINVAVARRSRSRVESWAHENGYQLVTISRRWFLTGPFLFRSSNAQPVYLVTLLDQWGHTGSAYVRVGSWFGGPLWSSKVTAVWAP